MTTLQYFAIEFLEADSKLQLLHVVDGAVLVAVVINVEHPAWLDRKQCVEYLMEYGDREAGTELAWSTPDLASNVWTTSEVIPA